MTKRLHHLFYGALFGILGLSFLLFVWSLYDDTVWAFFHGIYFFIMLLYTWYIAVLLFKGDLWPDKFQSYDGESIAVIMPVYNEDEDLFRKALASVVGAKGNKDIFVINDGSVKGMNRASFEKVCAEFGDKVMLHNFESNQGKRHALYHAIKHMVDTHDFVVTIDSDTLLDKDALIRVVEPLKDQKIGAATGDVQLLNEKQNLLTRMVGAYYWVGLNIYKQAQSNLGIVVCCSGCLAAYKTSLLKGIVEEFINQEFMGEKCTHSEDRHLTNLILRDGYKVKYVPGAISYTSTPHTVKGFLKQQQRWKRGFIRESTYTLTYAWRTQPILFWQILLCELTVPFLAFGLTLSLFLSIFLNPQLFATAILPSWIMFMCVRYIYIFFYGKRKIPGLLVYMFFYEAVLYWQFIYALFTVKNKSWITR